MTDEGHEKEAELEQDLEEKIQKIESNIGGLVEEHREILMDYEDIVERLDIATELLEHSQELERQVIDQSHNSGEINDELEDELALVIAILRGISGQLSEVKQEIDAEEQDLMTVQGYESKVFERSQELTRTFEVATDEEISKSRIRSHQEGLASMANDGEPTADHIRNYINQNDNILLSL